MFGCEAQLGLDMRPPAENPFKDHTGDGLDPISFLEGDKMTLEVGQLPIPVYAAYFNPDELKTIQAGIDIANGVAGMPSDSGQPLFVRTSLWSPDARVIYKVSDLEVNELGTVVGLTDLLIVSFHETCFAEVMVPDWAVRLTEAGINVITVAHELGHTMGLVDDALIDYEEDTLVCLEPNSVKDGVAPYWEEARWGDYAYMMRRQAEILLLHLGEQGDPLREECRARTRPDCG